MFGLTTTATNPHETVTYTPLEEGLTFESIREGGIYKHKLLGDVLVIKKNPMPGLDRNGTEKPQILCRVKQTGLLAWMFVMELEENERITKFKERQSATGRKETR